MANEQWPSLPYEDWKETYATLHMWSQIVGKIRLVQMPWFDLTPAQLKKDAQEERKSKRR